MKLSFIVLAVTFLQAFICPGQSSIPIYGGQPFLPFNAASFPGTDASIKINNCIQMVIAAGGGTCDARSLTGAHQMSQQIDLGNSSTPPAHIGIALLLPESAVWTWSLTDGTSCGIMQFSSTSLIGTQPGAGGN